MLRTATLGCGVQPLRGRAPKVRKCLEILAFRKFSGDRIAGLKSRNHKNPSKCGFPHLGSPAPKGRLFTLRFSRQARQLDYERGAAFGSIESAHGSSMIFHDSLGNNQSEPQAGFLPRGKGFEKPGQ